MSDSKVMLEMSCKCGATYTSYMGTDSQSARVRWQDDHKDCLKPKPLITGVSDHD